MAVPVLAPLSGKISNDSVVKIAHSDLDIGMRNDAPKPSTSTAEALKRLLLDVKSIAYAGPKSGGVRVLLTGYRQEVNKKSKLVTGMHNSELVAKGQVELAVQASHEILAVPGTQFTSMPPEFQSTLVFSAAVSASPKEPDTAKALVDFLSSWAKGMQPD